MRRSDNRAALTDEVARFQADVRRLALAVVQAVVREELDRKRAKLEPARPRKRPPARRPKRKPAPPPERQLELGLAQGPEPQLDLPLARPAEPEAAPPAEPQPAPAAAPPEQPPTPPAGVPKRPKWTRETITSELATWILSGTTIDAQFMTRHGPPGLVAAIRRVFGRFEAALNVAALHVSKLYPEGPPSRRLS
jgi:hypothetical protein